MISQLVHDLIRQRKRQNYERLRAQLMHRVDLAQPVDGWPEPVLDEMATFTQPLMISGDFVLSRVIDDDGEIYSQHCFRTRDVAMRFFETFAPFARTARLSTGVAAAA